MKPSLEDLDRCEHGRHRIDPCLMCPNGQSTGNLFVAPGARIGTSLYGESIVAPGEAVVRTLADAMQDTVRYMEKRYGQDGDAVTWRSEISPEPQRDVPGGLFEVTRWEATDGKLTLWWAAVRATPLTPEG